MSRRLKPLLKKIIPFTLRRTLRKMQDAMRYRFRRVLYQLWIFKYDRLTCQVKKRLA